MINPLIRVMIDRLAHPVWEFFKSLRSRLVSPPQPEFIHLIEPTPVRTAVNGKRDHTAQKRAINRQSRPRSH